MSLQSLFPESIALKPDESQYFDFDKSKTFAALILYYNTIEIRVMTH